MIELVPSSTQYKFLTAEEDIVFFGGGAGGGKCGSYDSAIQTPFGKRTMRDMKVGSIILNPDGTRQLVKAVYPKKDMDFYRVTFDDGVSTEVCLEHLWVTWQGGKQTKKAKRLLDSGLTSPPDSLFPAHASIKTTEELMDALSRGVKPLIPVTKPVTYETRVTLKIDPYFLGLLLGDGCITKDVCLCKGDEDTYYAEYLDSIGIKRGRSEGVRAITIYRENGIHELLDEMGLLGKYSHNKFIPRNYLFGSVEQRTHLLQGLMDSDGYVSADNKLYYDTVSPLLSDGVTELVQSLGGKCTVTTKIGQYRDDNGEVVECREVFMHYIRLPDSIQPFRMPRKLERVKKRGTRLYRRVVDIQFSRNTDGACITVDNPNRLYLTDGFIVTHNTWSILADNLKGVHDPDYLSVFFRTTTTELDTGLWPEAKKMYDSLIYDENRKFIGKAHINEQKRIITFPSGARTIFSYMEYDKHADSFYGSELTKIYFDELQFRSKYQFDVLYSRNRSISKIPTGMRCTLNPDRSHFVYDWVLPFLDEDGYPVPELAGKRRYFLVINDKLETSWDREELASRFSVEGEKPKNPQTYTYIPSLLEDNFMMAERDPTYRDKLDAMPEAKRKQLLLGCWNVDEDTGMYFKREWLIPADKVPFGSVGIRAYDLASSEPTKEVPFPDFTASIGMWRCPQKNIYITGNYVESFKDDETEVYGRFRKRSGARDNVMLEQAISDGDTVSIVLPEDSGAAGKDAFRSKVEFFTSNGFKVLKDSSVSNHNKLTKFEPFATAAEHGLVYIVESTFPNKATLDWFLSELEEFKGERSTRTRKDEAVDICASGFNTITKMRNVKIVTRNQQKPTTEEGAWLNRQIGT